MYIVIAFVVVIAVALIIPYLFAATKECRNIVDQLLLVPRRVIFAIREGLSEILNNTGNFRNEEQENKTLEKSIIEMGRISKQGTHSSKAYSGKIFQFKWYLIPLGAILLIFEGIALGRYLLFQSYTSSLTSVTDFFLQTIKIPSLCYQALHYQE